MEQLKRLTKSLAYTILAILVFLVVGALIYALGFIVVKFIGTVLVAVFGGMPIEVVELLVLVGVLGVAWVAVYDEMYH